VKKRADGITFCVATVAETFAAILLTGVLLIFD
jgi:hypothetical protein